MKCRQTKTWILEVEGIVFLPDLIHPTTDDLNPRILQF